MAQLTLQVDSPSVVLGDVPNVATLSAMKEAEPGNDAWLVDLKDMEHFMDSME